MRQCYFRRNQRLKADPDCSGLAPERGLPAPTVSVVIPAYQKTDFVNQAIDSVRSQTFQDSEIIVVDDCSEAGAIRVPDGVRLIRHATRRGPAVARNTGISAANGRYIALMDMDDIWLPEKLESQVSIMEADSEIGLTFCHHILVDENLQPCKEQPECGATGTCPFPRLLNGNLIRTCSLVMLRREAVEQCGMFDVSIGGSDDWDMWIRIARSFKVHSDAEPRVLYRTHPTQLSQDSLMMREGEAAVRLKWLTWAEQESPELARSLRKGLCNALRRLAKQQARRGLFSESARTMVRAVALCPTDIRCYLSLPELIFHWAHRH